MNYKMILAEDAKGVLWLKRSGEGKARRVCTLSTARKLLRKSSRQLYRNIQGGELLSYGKPFGEHLLDYESMKALGTRPLTRQPVPQKLQCLFPEYGVKNLNVGRDRVLILSRVLELGTLADIQWLLRRFSNSELKDTLKQDGVRILSKRAWNFWRLFFQLPADPKSSSSRATPWQLRNGAFHASS